MEKPRRVTLYDWNGQTEFLIGAQQGEGAFSEVFFGVHQATGTEVAVKTVKKSKGDAQRSQAHWLSDEIALHSYVSRKMPDRCHVAKFIAAYEDEDKLYMVMEACRGPSIFALCDKNNHFTEAEAAYVLLKAGQTLASLHSLGIAHRDIKGDNFMFKEGDSTSPLILIDFGLSLFLGTRDHLYSPEIVGSYLYAAPEVLSRGYYSRACDVWGFGILAYKLIMGHEPFLTEHEIQCAPLRFDGREVSDMAKDFITRMLKRVPTDRPTIQEVCQHPFLRNTPPDISRLTLNWHDTTSVLTRKPHSSHHSSRFLDADNCRDPSDFDSTEFIASNARFATSDDPTTFADDDELTPLAYFPPVSASPDEASSFPLSILSPQSSTDPLAAIPMSIAPTTSVALYKFRSSQQDLSMIAEYHSLSTSPETPGYLPASPAHTFGPASAYVPPQTLFRTSSAPEPPIEEAPPTFVQQTFQPPDLARHSSPAAYQPPHTARRDSLSERHAAFGVIDTDLAVDSMCSALGDVSIRCETSEPEYPACGSTPRFSTDSTRVHSITLPDADITHPDSFFTACSAHSEIDTTFSSMAASPPCGDNSLDTGSITPPLTPASLALIDPPDTQSRCSPTPIPSQPACSQVYGVQMSTDANPELRYGVQKAGDASAVAPPGYQRPTSSIPSFSRPASRRPSCDRHTASLSVLRRASKDMSRVQDADSCSNSSVQGSSYQSNSGAGYLQQFMAERGL